MRPARLRTLVVVHYHLRPGGVRSVIETCLPAIVKRMNVSRVLILAGEDAPDDWTIRLAKHLPQAELVTRYERACGYFSELTLPAATLRRRITQALDDAISADHPEKTLIWFHNPGLGRNLLLNEGLRVLIRRTGIRLVAHHHDFWVENRWSRWPEMRRAGFRTLSRAADAVFFSGTNTAQSAITRRDQGVLADELPAVAWLPNPARSFPKRTSAARSWLTGQLGDSSPVWILPTRLLRRKNIAEAILLTRWFCPDGWMISAGGASSAAEADYVRRIAQAAQIGRWRVNLGLKPSAGTPSVSDLMASSEAVLLTSVQEGFGLPFLEAASLGKPLIARRLDNIQPDLDALGVRVPHLYTEILIPCGLFDLRAEVARQRRIFQQWKSRLPQSIRILAEQPQILKNPVETIPFSRLTLTAQLEVLAHPAQESLAASQPWNPGWESVANRQWIPMELGKRAARFLSPESAAKRFAGQIGPIPRSIESSAASACLSRLIGESLRADRYFPILAENHSLACPPSGGAD